MASGQVQFALFKIENKGSTLNHRRLSGNNALSAANKARSANRLCAPFDPWSTPPKVAQRAGVARCIRGVPIGTCLSFRKRACAMMSKLWIVSSTSGPTLFDRFATSAQFGPKKRRATCTLIYVGFPSKFIRRRHPKGRRSRFLLRLGRRFARGSNIWVERSGFQSTRRNVT